MELTLLVQMPICQIQSPESVPVPADDDDDPFCEAFSLTENSVWKIEVNLDLMDIGRWKNDPHPEELAFLVSAAKKQKTEVKLATLTLQEKQQFQEAKNKEIQSWLDTKTVCRITRNQIPPQNILKCRWILT